MIKNRMGLVVGLVLVYATLIPAQQYDKGVFKTYKNQFWDSIATVLDAKNDLVPERLTFKVDFSNTDAPKTNSEFKVLKHTPPINQGRTSTCWDFATTSFLESEILRTTGKELKLSEMFTAYWEFVEKARSYIVTRGKTIFPEGSQADAVTELWVKYGIVPESVYDGKNGKAVYDHEKMYDEMKQYLSYLKTSGDWNPDNGIKTIRAILDHYMGVPPVEFAYEGKTITPKQFLNDYIPLKLDDYVMCISVLNQPFHEYSLYDVPDNWRRSKDYFNLPVEDFMKIINASLEKGVSVTIGGDVSEPGIDGTAGLAIVPTFDIAANSINDDARYFRFLNKTTTDDHLVHIIGSVNRNGVVWYLIKDSGSGVFNSTHPGYFYFRSDYVKLKMLLLMAHKDVVSSVIPQFKNK